MDASRWNIVHNARRQWERKLNDGTLTAAVEKSILDSVYAAVGLPSVPVYRFRSPLAALLSIPHLAAFHNMETPHGHLLTDLRDPLTSNLGQTEAWSRAGTGRDFFLDEAIRRPVKEQITVKFFDAYVDELGTLLRSIAGEDFAAKRIQCGIFQPINHVFVDWLVSVRGTRCLWWPFRKFAVLFQDEFEESIDDLSRLHCEDGPALWYPDGFEIYAWHGVIVPEYVIKKPETIDVDVIDKTTHVEVRRAMIERMGAGTYLQKSGAKLIDMDSLTLDGSAPRALLQDRHGNMWLVGTDGSTERVYTMSVPPDVRTCREAHIAICGFDENLLVAEA